MGACASALHAGVNTCTASLHSLKGSPKELYITFFLKVCDSFAYFCISQIIIIYLRDEFGLDDVQAGACYGGWGAAITFWGLVTSFWNDTIGVRRSLLIGYSMLIATLVAISMTTSLTLMLLCLFVFMPLANSMGIPMLTIGIRRYTTPANRGFAYGIFYSCMNIGAALSGPVVDFFNIAYKQGTSFGTRSISGNRMVIFSSAVAVAVALVTTALFVRDIRYYAIACIHCAYTLTCASR